MQFMVMGYDGKDDKAMERRLAVREEHLKTFEKNYNDGTFLYGCAQLDENDKMIGSVIVCEYESEDELKEKWLNNEPYVTGKVWEKVKIIRVKTPPIINK